MGKGIVVDGVARCGRRVKTCRECGYRYKAGDKSWECPECGEDRHCLVRVSELGEACRVHGGATPTGMASPNYIHGKYSKVAPLRLKDRYLEALHDEELLSLRDDLAMLEARIAELFGQLSEGENVGKWSDLQDTLEQLTKANRTGNKAGVASALYKLSRLIREGAAEQATWDEIYNCWEQKRRLTASEQDRLVAMRQMLTAEQAQMFVRWVMLSVREEVDDHRVVQRIQDRIREASSRRSR